MLCKYKFPVESTVQLKFPLTFQVGKTKFLLDAADGRFSSINAEIAGVQFTEHAAAQKSGPDGIPHIRIPTDPAFPFLQQELRAIRGALSVWGVQDIETEKPGFEWSPETAEEKANTSVFGYQVSTVPREERDPHPVSIDLLIRTIMARRRFLEYEIPFEFFRRGAEDSIHERYIESIYDFYFVFEYLWGNGKYRKKEIVSQMDRSAAAVAAVTHAVDDPHPELVRHPNRLKRFKENYAGKTTAEIFGHIVDLRGFLHHQSIARKKNWNPNRNDEFVVDSYFLYAAAHKAVLDLSLEILFEVDEFETFKNTPVFAPDCRRVNWKSDTA